MDYLKTIDAVSLKRPSKYRVITFQSKEVINIILQDKIYFADKDRMREGSICQEDIDVCGGKTPIWVFQHPCFISTNIGHGQWCEMLETFRCEMSIDTLDGLYMIELLINRQPPIGKAHNGTSIACIIDSIRIDDIAAIYRLKETEHWYFYEVQLVNSFKEDILFKSSITFTKELYKKDKSPRVKLSDYKSSEDYYIPTSYHIIQDELVKLNVDVSLYDSVISLLPTTNMSEEMLRDSVRMAVKCLGK